VTDDSISRQGAIDTLSVAQPEVKPIDYRDCADAMLMMEKE